MNETLALYKPETERDLNEILQHWMDFATDEVNGGFVGRIAEGNKKIYGAPKGPVRNGRIRWSFSAACNLTGKKAYPAYAKKAYDYFIKRFIDRERGVVYRTVSSTGEALDAKKQIYAQAFAVYGLSEYGKTAKDDGAKEEAIGLYRAIVEHGYDKVYGGYGKALTRDWQTMRDVRLSLKDANEPKSTNTHLHVLEGFAALYAVWPDEGLKEKLVELVHLFLEKVISSKTRHLLLFFKDDRTPKATVISYGHDIEAAELSGDEELTAEVKAVSLKMAKAAANGLDEDGGLWYEYDATTKHLVTQKQWWPQAEAMVGFLNAWQISGDDRWLRQSITSWRFVNECIKDPGGEWRWGINEDGKHDR